MTNILRIFLYGVADSYAKVSLFNSQGFFVQKLTPVIFDLENVELTNAGESKILK